MYRFGSFRFDAARGQLFDSDEVIELPQRAVGVLDCLLTNAGQLVLKQELLDAGWQDAAVTEHSLIEAVKLIRHALGDDSAHPEYIQTVHRRGYRFVAPVTIEADSPTRLASFAGAHPGAIGAPGTGHRQRSASPLGGRGRAMGAGLLLGGTLVAALAFSLIPRAPAAPPPAYRQITFAGDATYSAISPDGDFAAYVTGGQGRGWKVWVHDVDGGQSLQVFDSPRVCEVYEWSPDGLQVMFECLEEDITATLYLAHRFGGLGQHFRGGFTRRTWSPDGSRFAGIRPRSKSIELVTIDDGHVATLTPDVPISWMMGLDWAPDGQRLLFGTLDNGVRTLWTIAPDGTQLQRVLEGNLQPNSPQWAPAGDAIYFMRPRGIANELWKIAVDPRTGAADGAATVVVAGLQAGPHFSVTRDGRRLLYVHRTTQANLWVTELDHATELPAASRPLTKGTAINITPSISPDGSMIAYSSGNGQSSNIFVMPINGGTPRQLTFLDSVNRSPAWSPDMTTLAFGSTEGGLARVWTVRADGGRVQLLRGTELSGTPMEVAWAPADAILYQTTGNGNFIVHDPLTGSERLLMQNRPRQWAFLPRVSPDGSEVALFLNRRPIWGLWVQPLQPGAAGRQIAGRPCEEGRRSEAHAATPDDRCSLLPDEATVDVAYEPIGWMPDGSHLIGIQYGTGRIAMIPAAGGPPRVLIDALGEPGQAIKGAVIDPAGRLLVYPVQESQSDVWVVDHFDPAIR